MEIIVTDMPKPLTLDTASGLPIYRQIIDWVKMAMADQRMVPGQQLPTVRQLAVDLNVNYNTVARSYLELERMGLVNTLRGKGTFITLLEVSADEVQRGAKLRSLVLEFLAKAAEFGFGPDDILSELGAPGAVKKERS
jgi:GntR family transcriptional regulator